VDGAARLTTVTAARGGAASGGPGAGDRGPRERGVALDVVVGRAAVVEQDEQLVEVDALVAGEAARERCVEPRRDEPPAPPIADRGCAPPVASSGSCDA